MGLAPMHPISRPIKDVCFAVIAMGWRNHFQKTGIDGHASIFWLNQNGHVHFATVDVMVDDMRIFLFCHLLGVNMGIWPYQLLLLEQMISVLIERKLSFGIDESAILAGRH